MSLLYFFFNDTPTTEFYTLSLHDALPIAPEYPQLREGLVLFTYLHIAADEPLTRALADSGIAAVAYETVETDDHRLPLLAPMSEIAGRLAPQAAAHFLEKPLGGRGVLLAGTPGVQPGHVVVL